MMAMRGIRGATSVAANTREEIVAKTVELLSAMMEKNGVEIENVASAIFSVTDDVNAEFPAVAARKLGWIYTPLFCTREIPVPGSLQGCIRVLLHVNSEKRQDEIVHLYLHEAKKLRPDMGGAGEDAHYISRL
jgi:chorismate mutase